MSMTELTVAESSLAHSPLNISPPTAMSLDWSRRPAAVNVYEWLQTPEVITELVANASPKAAVSLSNLPEVVAFARITKGNANIGRAVRDLSITVSRSEFFWNPAGHAAYPSSIQSVLRMTHEVTDLTLLLPWTTPTHIFFLVRFPNLSFFKTNLPHEKIKPFVSAHNDVLSVLVLDSCQSDGDCPLAGIALDCLTQLECDVHCASSLMHNNVTHLQIANNSPQFSVPVLFRQLMAPFHDLYNLTLDFYPADIDILRAISLVAPRLRKLKLVEKPIHVGRRISIRRPFNDHVSWYRDLRKLPLLEELALRTTA
ncbi:hypothetical protein L227DRAFT_616375 [Lentinus tigrinus ALCF2SS1-6]|uniref:F-box domain-containing protein n=1 Tax=Lentinus tigrinus ALCF2SS1-6 TaxID=1328759 RepID=A0A5C2RR68_9APHY|nr:hypothetical protein L227DRAFT_616375 [Lentinus tigrinus ALCF2SS1-6]